MRTPPCLALLVAFTLACSAPAHAAAPTRHALTTAARPPRPGVVLVALAPGTSLATTRDGALRAADPALAATLRSFSLAHAAPLARGVARVARPEFVALRSDAPDFDPYAAAAALRGAPGVLAASPDLNLRLHLVPNDPYLPDQWHLGTSVAAVRARPAWDLETGSSSVAIGVIDTGVDTGHPDLASKVWHNPGEIPANGLDDDGNGYVDDVKGWDFGDDDANPDPDPLFDAATGIDVGWHGTFVSGIAAAAANDATGIAGIAWGCRVLPLKVANAAGDMPLSAVTAAVLYAIDNGARVLNLSLGSADPGAAAFFQPLVTAAYAANVVVVASAGNDGTDALNYPAACDSALSVAATNSANNRADFSNWGPTVDLAAPGEAMWSSIARNYPYDDYSLIFFEILWGYDDVNPYMLGDGTSFSAPVVAGAAALVRSRYPALTAGQVMRQLVLNGDARTYDNPIGPRLNIERALANPLAVGPAAAPAALAFAPPSPNPAGGPVRLAFALPRAARVTLRVLDAQGRLVRELLDGGLAAGGGSATWDLIGRDGRPVAAGLYFAVLNAGGESAARRLAVVR